MSEVITIEGHVNRWIVVPHRSGNARLWFYAPGLEVYVKGEGASKSFDVIANIAMNEALARNIPAGSLKTAARPENNHGGRKPAAGKPVNKPLFKDDDTTGG